MSPHPSSCPEPSGPLLPGNQRPGFQVDIYASIHWPNLVAASLAHICPAMGQQRTHAQLFPTRRPWRRLVLLPEMPSPLLLALKPHLAFKVVVGLPRFCPQHRPALR